jgi:hypothetical protein
VGELKKWREEKWVRIGTDGSILGACGTSKDKKNPDRCLPLKKAKSMSKSERAATAKKKKRQGRSQQFVANTSKARVTKKFTRRA